MNSLRVMIVNEMCIGTVNNKQLLSAFQSHIHWFGQAKQNNQELKFVLIASALSPGLIFSLNITKGMKETDGWTDQIFALPSFCRITYTKILSWRRDYDCINTYTLTWSNVRFR